MTKEQLDGAVNIAEEINFLEEELGKLEEVQSWGNDGCWIKGVLKASTAARSNYIEINDKHTMRMLIDILHDKYTAKIEELEKEFEEL